MLSNKGDLRVKLESALKGQQEAKSKVDSSLPNLVHHQPTIKLKTDFSNFASKS